MPTQPDSDLARSHADLRAAVILAGREIRRLNVGRKDSPVLRKLREVLKDARVVSKTGSEQRKDF